MQQNLTHARFRILLLTCVIPTLQVLLHCIYFGKYPNPLPIAVHNRETDCSVYDPCEHIENCTFFSCHFLNLLSNNNIEAVSK